MFYMILAVDREKMSFVQKYFWRVKNPKFMMKCFLDKHRDTTAYLAKSYQYPSRSFNTILITFDSKSLSIRKVTLANINIYWALTFSFDEKKKRQAGILSSSLMLLSDEYNWINTMKTTLCGLQCLCCICPWGNVFTL